MRLRAWIEKAWEATPGKPPPGTWILSALAALYGAGIALRRHRPQAPPLPTISVGSLLVGGAGKTPLAIEISDLASRMGMRPAVLLRGYGGRVRTGVKVAMSGPSSVALYGDEACMHARRGHAGVWVGRDRLATGELARQAGARLLILDDGMQHTRIRRDLEIVTLPAWHPLGNGRLLPRGPLREPRSSLGRADLIVLSHCNSEEELEDAIRVLRRAVSETPIVSWTGSLTLRALRGSVPLPASAIGAFCGIGRPQEFKRSLERMEFKVPLFRAYADHHVFTRDELGGLARAAKEQSLSALITTEKDALRLPSALPGGGISWCEAVLSLNWRSGEDRETVLAALRKLSVKSG